LNYFLGGHRKELGMNIDTVKTIANVIITDFGKLRLKDGKNKKIMAQTQTVHITIVQITLVFIFENHLQ
jgi:hypothetical protein